MKAKLKNILEKTSGMDKGIICLDIASSAYTEYQMKQRVKHLSLNLDYSGYEFSSINGMMYLNDLIVNELATAFLITDNKNDQMLREKLLKFARYYTIPSICWIPSSSNEVTTIYVADTSSDVVSAPLFKKGSKELLINFNGMKLLVSLDLKVNIPYNYFSSTNFLGKMGIHTAANKHWWELEV